MRHAFTVGIAFIFCISLLSCAGPVDRNLQSITLSPAAAESGQGVVQFTATDHWSASPIETGLKTPIWGACQNGEPPTTVTITKTGLATCGAGAKGTYTIFAEDPGSDSGPVCNVIDACGRGCQIIGSAQLTCN